MCTLGLEICKHNIFIVKPYKSRTQYEVCELLSDHLHTLRCYTNHIEEKEKNEHHVNLGIC